MTRARNIANPTQITIPLDVSANISSNATISVGNTEVNSFITDTTIAIGNSSVNTIIHSTGITANGANIHSINASSIASGTLDTDRLPATANITTAINVGANVSLTTSGISVGNSTVNTSISNQRIGINTSPNKKLHIKADNYDDFIQLERTGVGSVGISATNPVGLQTTDANGNFKGLHVDISTGNIGAGTNSPNAPLHVSTSNTEGAIRIGGGNGSGNQRVYINSGTGGSSYIDSYGDNTFQKLSLQAFPLHINTSSNGYVQLRRFQHCVHHGYVTSGSEYIHLKTTVGTNLTHMITFILDYYSYGAARHGQSRFSVHNDGSVNMYSARATSIYDTYITNMYRSSDGYVVLVQQSPGTYFYGWTLHALHNMGYGTFDVGLSAYTTSSSSSGAY